MTNERHSNTRAMPGVMQGFALSRRRVHWWECGSIWINSLEAWSGVRASWANIMPLCERKRWHRGDHRPKETQK